MFPTFFSSRGLPAGAYYYFSVILIIVMLQDALQDARATVKNGAVAAAPAAAGTATNIESLVTIDDAGVAKTTIPVGGMTCASCVMHVQNALLEVDGVLAADVNLATERATVQFGRRKPDLPVLKQAIYDSGYDVREITVTRISMTLSVRPRAARDRGATTEGRHIRRAQRPVS